MLAALALGALGCASSAQVERQAAEHAARADQAAAMGKYQLAAREQREAQRLREKASGVRPQEEFPRAPSTTSLPFSR